MPLRHIQSATSEFTLYPSTQHRGRMHRELSKDPFNLDRDLPKITQPQAQLAKPVHHCLTSGVVPLSGSSCALLANEDRWEQICQ